MPIIDSVDILLYSRVSVIWWKNRGEIDGLMSVPETEDSSSALSLTVIVEVEVMNCLLLLVELLLWQFGAMRFVVVIAFEDAS